MLQTPYVFVDSELFVRSRFDLESGRLKRLADLAKAGRVRIVLPAITRSELSKKLRDSVSEAFSALQSLRSRGRVLRLAENLDCGAIFEPIDREAVTAELEARLENYFAEVKALLVEPPSGGTQRVLDRYFDGLPPFGQSRKKHEFPDAFALDALGEWCREEEVRVYLISGDPDLVGACTPESPFLHLEHLEDLFDLIQAHDERIEALIAASNDAIVEQIAESFANSGFYLEEEDGDVGSIEVRSVEITEVRIQEIVEQMVFFETSATIVFVVGFTYNDYSTAIYDSEDKRYYFWDTVEGSARYSTDVVAYGDLETESEQHREVLDVHIHLDTSEDYGIYLDKGEPVDS